MIKHRHLKPLDMLNGPIIPAMLRFAIPLMLTGILQLLYNAADLIVVGRFTGNDALAAVGATGSLNALLINVFIGISSGANVVIARAVGAGDQDAASSSSHTSILFSILSGTVLSVLGIFLSPLFLTWMSTPENVLDSASLYMRILSIGFPANLLYNFGAAILRSVGDTRRPLYFLTVSGVVNVVLNLFLVLVCHLGVAGVAIATIVSQYLSALLVLLALRQMHSPCRLFWDRLRIRIRDLMDILRIGLPAGIQSACFSISNVLIQSAINSFGSLVVAGNTSASNVDSFIYTAITAVYQSALTFTGQNMGAKQYRRIPKVVHSSLLLTFALAGSFGVIIILLRHPLLSLYSTDEMVIAYGSLRLLYCSLPYVLDGWMENYSSTIRAMGHSLVPMIVILTSVCGIRILAILTVFRWIHSLHVLFSLYPVTWTIGLVAMVFTYRRYYQRLLQREEAETPADPPAVPAEAEK